MLSIMALQWLKGAAYYWEIRIRVRMSFIASYVYTYEEFVFVTEASTVQQNDSDRTITQIIKE